MQAKARLKYLMMSPRKVRRVVTLIKGKSVDDALKILKFTNKAAAQPLAKTIQSAASNALSIEGTARLKAENLSIFSINIDEGPRAKRARFRAMGRVFRYKKRFAHITVVVEGEVVAEEKPKKRLIGKKAEKPEKKAPVKKATATKKAAKKTTATKKKATTKKTTKKTTVKKTTAKESAAKKTTTKATTAAKKKAAAKPTKKDK